MNPLKQGLKRVGYINFCIINPTVKEVNPLKQGLKPDGDKPQADYISFS